MNSCRRYLARELLADAGRRTSETAKPCDRLVNQSSDAAMTSNSRVLSSRLRVRVLPSIVQGRPELRGVRFGRRRHGSAEREIRRTRVQRDGHECEGATLPLIFACGGHELGLGSLPPSHADRRALCAVRQRAALDRNETFARCKFLESLAAILLGPFF